MWTKDSLWLEVSALSERPPCSSKFSDTIYHHYPSCTFPWDTMTYFWAWFSETGAFSELFHWPFPLTSTHFPQIDSCVLSSLPCGLCSNVSGLPNDSEEKKKVNSLLILNLFISQHLPPSDNLYDLFLLIISLHHRITAPSTLQFTFPKCMTEFLIKNVKCMTT